ncbi:hypothetical protein IAE60_03005 [Pseudoxanthomonas mexicana]|uniref:DUF541 domain-containing protein n=1 Tax=Pseudoxanthomonas mexicana TaxID=128785 RepID=A0A7G9TE98_PSEMX|nr:hypothetical protein [Pseudoxanthomonas mexicana]QNN78423.1 hypothetical protein IAE60_03005 [Pseudoxanthomonas mexicana]
MNRSSKHQVHVISQVMLFVAMALAMLSLANAARSESLGAAPEAGEEYEISKTYQTSEHSSDGSSGSSNGRDTLVERVISVREGGLELEFDLPKQATAEDRARSWQFPVRVFRSTDGSMQVLNRSELEARIEGWLKAAGWTRAECGRWIVTWNVFRIECDPESVIKAVESFDLRSAGIREGDAYREPGARGPGILTRKSTGADGATFVVVLEIDPDAVRRARAEADVVVGEMTQKPVTLDDALRERANEDVSGTISVTIDTDLVGNIRRRTKVTSVETKGRDSTTERRTETETVERRPVPNSGGASLLLD